MDVIENTDYTLFKVTDCHSVKELEFQLEEINYYCVDNLYFRIIVDLREMRFHIREDISPRRQLGLMAERHLDTVARVAFIVNHEKTDYEKAEIRAANDRGIYVDIFPDLEEAEDWLLH